MKQFYTLLFALFISAFSYAQTAPDFTVTDLEGNEINLYTLLDEGKVVVLDCSATWCSPCWGFHQGHFLQDIHDKYGPDGTDQVRVIFYEADPSTTLADLEGTTTSTQGNWLEDVTYPYVNETPVTLDGSIFWPLGYPTINVIRPDDKEIVADLFDPWNSNLGLAGMEEIIENAFPIASSTKSLQEVNVSVYPNPFVDVVTVDMSESSIEYTTIQVVSIQGAVLKAETSSTSKVVSFNVENLPAGVYFLNILNKEEVVGVKKLTK